MATLIVLALTGFTTGRGGHSKSRSSSGGGGGCSSSSQSHDSTTSHVSKGSSGSGSRSGTGYTRTRHRSTTSASPTSSARDATVKLLRCADAHQTYALVSVTNPNSRQVRFDVHGTFAGADGGTVADRHKIVEVPARGKATAQLPVGGKSLAADVDHCVVDPYAVALR
ncbi:hypothetical protein ABZY90_06025 [Streptomyces sp. NPDC006422]|uniref:hypothetical protein n=1 Tax=unclassified Streptomyces TaxID=2593676 RepID=UPI0033B03A03